MKFTKAEAVRKMVVEGAKMRPPNLEPNEFVFWNEKRANFTHFDNVNFNLNYWPNTNGWEEYTEPQQTKTLDIFYCAVTLKAEYVQKGQEITVVKLTAPADKNILPLIHAGDISIITNFIKEREKQCSN